MAFESQALWDVGVFEDGRDIEDKRTQRSGANWINRDQQQFALGALIASVESEDAITEELAELYKHVSVLPNQPQSNIPIAGVTAVSQASQDWRFYFSRTCWILSSTAVAEINLRPQVAEAADLCRRWRLDRSYDDHRCGPTGGSRQIARRRFRHSRQSILEQRFFDRRGTSDC